VEIHITFLITKVGFTFSKKIDRWPVIRRGLDQYFYNIKKMVFTCCYCILKNEKNPRPNIIERKLKKIMIINPHESKCRRMKLRKQSIKKILKNKAPSKPSKVVKTCG
jgi:hypothetical protein